MSNLFALLALNAVRARRQEKAFEDYWTKELQRLQNEIFHKVTEIRPGVYEHVFTPPEMTMEDLARLLQQLPERKEQ